MKVVFGLLIIAAASLTVLAQGQSEKALAEIINSTEKVVKGAPFSAEAVVESMQTLTDGNRITRTYSNKMYRDAEGRFRRDGIPNPGAALGIDITLPTTIVILDPVNGFKYYLNSDKKTVRKLTFRISSVITTTGVGTYTIERGRVLNAAEYADAEKKLQAAVQAGASASSPRAAETTVSGELERTATGRGLTGQLVVASGISGALVGVPGGGSYNTTTKTEDLGTQTIEGVLAEGKRTITTIPVGAIGNEKPIDITYERWYSKDLDMIVSSKHSDPRFGDQIYRLTNILRSEPDHSLFSVPSDFKVVFDQGYQITWPGMNAAPPVPKQPAPTPKPPEGLAPKPKVII